jgi:hypothetical protein
MTTQTFPSTLKWLLVSAISTLLFTGCDNYPIEPGTPKVDRSLVSQDLMLGLPVNNRVIDPEYYLSNSLTSWFLEKLNGNFSPCESFRRVSLKSQPIGRNALKIDGAQHNTTGCAAWGVIKVGIYPVNISVWVGSVSEDFDQQLLVQSHYYQPSLSHSNLVQSLEKEDNSRMVIDDIVWYQYRGNIPEGAIGIADIMLEYTGTDSILIAGATAIDVESKAKMYYGQQAAHPMTESLRKRLEMRQVQQENQMF